MKKVLVRKDLLFSQARPESTRVNNAHSKVHPNQQHPTWACRILAHSCPVGVASVIKLGVQSLRSSRASPVMPCKVLEEVMQVSGGPTAPAKVETGVASQLSICHTASLDTVSLLGACACSQVHIEEAAGQRL